MAEKARLFHDRHAEEIIIVLAGSRAHIRIGRGVRKFDYAI